jgi:hypothetical protein
MAVKEETKAGLLQVEDFFTLYEDGPIWFATYVCSAYTLIRRLDGTGCGTLLPEAKVWRILLPGRDKSAKKGAN